MVSRILAKTKAWRKVKRFNACWQLFVSRAITLVRKCYPDAEALLAVAYPPGYLLHRNRKRFTRTDFKLRPDLPRNFGLHGLFASPWFKMQQKLMLRRQARRKTTTTTVQSKVNLTQLSDELKERIVKCMPYLTRANCLKLMDHEREKHVPEIDFLDVDSYPEFAVRMFENYKFNELLSFVVEEISSNQTPVWEFSYHKEEWIGIRLADLMTIAEKHQPISEVGSKTKLTFRLIPTKLAQDQFFLFEAHVGVTKHGKLKRGGPISSVFRKVREIPTPDSIILLWNQLQY